MIHSAQMAVSAKLTDSVIAYAELLYDPQQSFGAGTITALTRKQIQLRRGWVMVGNLDKSPAYALIGKMDVPFGLNETVTPSPIPPTGTHFRAWPTVRRQGS